MEIRNKIKENLEKIFPKNASKREIPVRVWINLDTGEIVSEPQPGGDYMRSLSSRVICLVDIPANTPYYPTLDDLVETLSIEEASAFLGDIEIDWDNAMREERLEFFNDELKEEFNSSQREKAILTALSGVSGLEKEEKEKKEELPTDPLPPLEDEEDELNKENDNPQNPDNKGTPEDKQDSEGDKQEEEIDYNSMLRKELDAIALSYGLDPKDYKNKADIIKAIKSAAK